MDLFDSSQFLTKDHSGAWTPLLQSTYIVSNSLMAISYFIIPFILISVWRRKRKDIEYSWMIILFSAFIFFSGISHVINITSFWWAPYRFYVLLHFLSGCVSFVTMLTLPVVIRKKLRLMSREQYHRLNNELQISLSQKEIAIVEKNKIIDELESQLRQLERMKARGLWYSEQEEVLESLRKVLKTRITNDN